MLTATEIEFAYAKGKNVVNRLSFSLDQGELAGLVGPNGSGKSTFLRILAGLLVPVRGDVRFNDRPILKIPLRERARLVGLLPQTTTMAFGFTVEEVVAFGRHPHTGVIGFLDREDLDIVERCLKQTDIESLRAQPVTCLSGGEYQRTLLASVLAQEPRVMLLDEPAASLDIHHQAAFFERLRASVHSGLAAVCVTHDLNLAAHYCDRIYLISEGALVAEGKPAAVFRQDILERVYGNEVLVGTHPQTGGPILLPRAVREDSSAGII